MGVLLTGSVMGAAGKQWPHHAFFLLSPGHTPRGRRDLAIVPSFQQSEHNRSGRAGAREGALGGPRTGPKFSSG